MLNESSVIVTDTAYSREATCCAALFSFEPEVFQSGQQPFRQRGSVIIIKTDSAVTHPEGYILRITTDTVRIGVTGTAGAFYAVQTLRQLLPPETETGGGGAAVRLPCLRIEDAPRFPWRGVMLDCARHYQRVAFIMRYLELAALHKINIFHWHLTDDQGWRIESSRYPSLTETGAWRRQGDSLYGGYYTQEEIRKIVRYARDLHITVVPEIEMPGHSFAVLASYPDLSCTGGPFQIPLKWGVFYDMLCAGNPDTYTFVRGILEEVCSLFPSPWIHLGGDECLTKRWEQCPRCQALVTREHMTEPQELVDYFQAFAVHVLDSLGRMPVGWSEMLMGEVPPRQHIQAWYGHWSTMDALGRGTKAIVSQHDICYLHHDYLTVPIAKAYSFDPLPPEFEGRDTSAILGMEACLWGECTPTEELVDHKTYPRLCAHAETMWSQASRKDWNGFLARLGSGMGPRLDRIDVEYYRDPAVAWDAGTIPTVLEAEQIDSCTVQIRFSAPVVPEYACDPHCYTLELGSACLTSVVMTSPESVRLTWKTAGGDSLRFALDGIRSGATPWSFISDTLAPDGLYRFSMQLEHAERARVDGKPVIGMEVYPQPWIQTASGSGPTIRLRLQDPGDVTLTLCDCLGRVLSEQHHYGLAGGLHWIPLEAPPSTPGMYWLRLTTAHGSATRKLLLQR